MFEPKSKMTPQAEADFLIQEIRDTRTAYDNATVDKWRAQHLGMIGLRMSALVRAARKVLAAAHPATQSDTDADQCTMLEARTSTYLNSASRLAATMEHEWPRDIQQEIDAQADDLIRDADAISAELAAIVAQYPAP